MYVKYSATRKRFLQFCKKNKADPQEILGYCEGKLSNFPFWYADYTKYVKNELKRRIRTGIVTKIEMRDVWS